MIMRHFLVFMVFFSVISQIAWAQRKSNVGVQTAKIAVTQQNYSGTLYHSLSEGSPAYGVEFSVDRGNLFLRYFLKGRMSYSEGIQSFLNAGTPFKSLYRYTAFAPELGISLYPVSKRDKGMNIYLWGVGTVSYNFLEISTVPTGSAVLSKDQGVAYGYGGGIGFEFMLGGGRVKSKSMIYGEFGFKDERAQLVKENNFEISGMTFSLGYGFN